MAGLNPIVQRLQQQMAQPQVARVMGAMGPMTGAALRATMPGIGQAAAGAAPAAGAIRPDIVGAMGPLAGAVLRATVPGMEPMAAGARDMAGWENMGNGMYRRPITGTKPTGPRLPGALPTAPGPMVMDELRRRLLMGGRMPGFPMRPPGGPSGGLL